MDFGGLEAGLTEPVGRDRDGEPLRIGDCVEIDGPFRSPGAVNVVVGSRPRSSKTSWIWTIAVFDHGGTAQAKYR